MKVGVLKDIKVGEYRVIATPAEVSMLVGDGNEVYVQKGAGEGSGFSDEAYVKEGAKLVDTKEEIYATCDFVAKVKEFEPCEYKLLRENQIVFTCIHPAAHPEEVQALTQKRRGLVLVTGPTGSGKSTTLASLPCVMILSMSSKLRLAL